MGEPTETGPRRPSAPPALVLLAAAALGGWAVGRADGPTDLGARAGDRHDDLGARMAAGPPPLARVEEVVDGDTARVRVRPKGGPAVRVTVRYLGIDTPESVHPSRPVECWGPAAARLGRRWGGGRLVRLRFDREPADRYGRLLAMLEPVGGGPSLNARLVAAGAARVLTIAPNGRWREPLRRAEARARRAPRGLWRDCPAADDDPSGR